MCFNSDSLLISTTTSFFILCFPSMLFFLLFSFLHPPFFLSFAYSFIYSLFFLLFMSILSSPILLLIYYLFIYYLYYVFFSVPFYSAISSLLLTLFLCLFQFSASTQKLSFSQCSKFQSTQKRNEITLY